MKSNIIFSGADATGKTTRAKNLEKQGYTLSILKKEIDILTLTIKENVQRATNQGINSDNNVVMDRSLIDLLAYYYTNDKNGFLDKDNGLGNIHSIKTILQRFIILNKGGVFNYLIASKEVIIDRLLKRASQGEELSENDLKIINQEGYLDQFIDNFNKIMIIFEKLNNKMGNLITINRIDTSKLVMNA